ncbi:hypothetical protein M0802_016271 [Mischocyttarus mexicanus]|nr:hypothetical protein M0802_016271 [Mischocyttarus mexicanus]
MDSHVGLDYIVDNPDYCIKLASALDTACTSVKKQVVELLSALCVYSQDGRQRAIDTLHTYQVNHTYYNIITSFLYSFLFEFSLSNEYKIFIYIYNRLFHYMTFTTYSNQSIIYPKFNTKSII